MTEVTKHGLGDSVFLVRTLEKIISDKELKRSQHQRVKKTCEESLKELKDEIKTIKSQTSKSVLNADKYFLPLELACRTNVPRITQISLDCIQKLIAYGLLKGESTDPDNPDKYLIDKIIDTICGCFVGVHTDEGIQLQIIKALLTTLTSNVVGVHGGTVLQAVRCCYNIYLASRNPINQTTAKASLTQIISTLFQNLENEESLQLLARDKMAMSYPTPPPSRSDNQSESSMQSHDRLPDLVEEETKTSQLDHRGSKDRHDDNGHHDDDDPELVATAVKLVQRVLAKVVSEQFMNLPSNYVEEGRLEGDVMVTGSHGGFDDSESLPSNVSEIKENSTVPLQSSSGNKLVNGHLQFHHVLQKDCFLVFRTLCKLSMKPINDVNDPRSHELRSKILSLELLLSILENSGPVFRTDEVFIGAIKHHLCVALSKNGVSSVPEVFELSLSIFLALFSSFKVHLKMQIEVFFKEIFLNILETSTSSFKHKWLVLQALMRICNDSQDIVDIYLNYDCDLSLSNIYSRLVNDLSRMGQGRQAVELGATPLQEKGIRAKGLECLVSILKCLVEWSRDIYINPATTGLNAISPISGGSGWVGPSQPVSKHVTADNSKRQKSVSVARGGVGEAEQPEGIDSPEQFEIQKLKKETMEKGIKLFSTKPKKGIVFLQEKGLLGKDPSDVAHFFYTDERLDKTGLGDYMGESDEYNKAVMYAYVDCYDFTGLDFVAALRLMLSGFRLPGEAQKIDRIMEKFAGRYYETHSSLEIFASADAAYVLAYSIIMLTTDLHSTQVKRKMTKEDYIKMNRGINDSKDLPREYLESIYDEIASSEIKLKTTYEAGKQIMNKQSMVGISEKRRQQIYTEQSSLMAETAQSLIEHISDKQAQFTSATHVDHVRSMFKLTWTPVLAALSVALRDSDDTDVVSICLDGFRCAIRVACIFGLNLERDAYVKTLAKFTMLMTSTGITEMKAKNIEVIKTLCTVAYTDGNYLQSSWIDVLQCISQLELVQLIGTGVKTRYLTSSSSPAMPSSSSGGAGPLGASIDAILTATDAKKIATLQEQVEGTSNQSVVVAVDRIFTGTTRLDGTAIVDFVEALCAVSNEELSNPAHPRMFSLQKIIELSYYNMGRIRLEMSRIWEVIGAHFNTVGCLPNEEVSFFVVDSLRQLSMKFVEKKELANFRFQKDFLRPFEYIMKRNDSVTIRDMVVRCVTQMIQSKAQNIVSGWKNIFSVFLLAAADYDQTIVELSFQTTASIFESHFEATIDSFQDAIKCLAEFACNASYPDTSMEAIRIIRICAKHVAERPELFQSVDDVASLTVVTIDKVWVKAWLPIMFELSNIISRCKLDVRTRGLTVMFEIMKTHGHLYHQRWWSDLFNVIFRLFGNMKLPDTPNEKSEWMTTTCNHALYALMDVFMQFFDTLCPVLLSKVLDLLLWCVKQDNEQLARSGTNCLENLVITVGNQLTGDIWDKICGCIRDIYEATVPHDLLSWQPSEGRLSAASSYSSLHSEIITQPDKDTASLPQSVVANVTDNVTSSPVDVKSSADSNIKEQLATNNTLPSPDQSSSTRVPVTTVTVPATPTSTTPTGSITQKQNTKPVVRSKAPSVSSSKDEKQPKRTSSSRRKDEKPKRKRKEESKRASQSVDMDNTSEISYNHPDTDMTMTKTKSQQLSVHPSEHYTLFTSLIIKCVVQLELIQTIDNVVFHPTITRQDDQNILHAAGVMSAHYPLPLPPYTNQGMFQVLSTQQLFILLDCLEASHEFSRSFNSNQSQRLLLMRAGFRGKSKPNLLRQETSSLLTSLRILYRMLEDDQRTDDYSQIDERLIKLVHSSLTYFLSLSSDIHSASWTPVLLLIFTRMLQVTTEEFMRHMSKVYPLLCELVTLELKYEVRCLLRRVFTRLGKEYGVCPFD